MNESLQQAAMELQQKLSCFSWVRMVGIETNEGVDAIVVYVARITKAVRDKVPSSFAGFCVRVQTMSKPISAAR